MSKEYEFNESQNSSFLMLSKNLKFVSIALMVVGIATMIETVLEDTDLFLILSGLTWLLMGIVFYLPIDNFKNITTTKGRDIKELMIGLKELDKGWVLVLIALSLNKLVQLIAIASY